MKRLIVISGLCILFCTPFVAGKGVPAPAPYADSLRSVYLYTEGITRNLIDADTAAAIEHFRQVIEADPDYAPAHFELARILIDQNPLQAKESAHRASELDTANKWYLELYGQTLLNSGRYDSALDVYRRLGRLDHKNPDIYRIQAALYEQLELPFSAIAVLDSAELRFGRIPLLTEFKRRLLVQTKQYDKAVDEAKAMAEEAPYEVDNRLMLGELYGVLGRDSLAMAEFSAAMRIDSTNITTLATLADYYNRRQNYRSFLAISKRIFEQDKVPLKNKIDQFERLVTDTRFYREYFLQINELATTLAIKYPDNPKVVNLYGQHLIASGELDRALELYKHHTTDRPAMKEYFTMVVDIESYKQRTDSANKYIAQAIELFPDAPEFYIARGHTHSYAKNYSKAIESYRASLRHARTDSLRGVVWGFIGDSYSAAEQMKQCYKAYDKSLGYYRDNPMVLNNYAYFLSQQGAKLDRALEMSSRTIALAENNPTYLDTYAWVLYKLGRIAEAKKSIQLAISLDRDKSPELMLHYGDILAAGGEDFMAEVYWRKALENGYKDAGAIARRFEQLKKTQTEKTTNP